MNDVSVDAGRLDGGEALPGQRVVEQQSTDEPFYMVQRLPPQRQGWQQARLDGRTREYALQGGVSVCARDMVKECRRCGKVVCRVGNTYSLLYFYHCSFFCLHYYIKSQWLIYELMAWPYLIMIRIVRSSRRGKTHSTIGIDDCVKSVRTYPWRCRQSPCILSRHRPKQSQ